MAIKILSRLLLLLAFCTTAATASVNLQPNSELHVASISALNLTPLNKAQSFILDGYYGLGTKGGGILTICTSCTVDNISVFADSNSIKYQRQNPTWDVAEGGLKADGTTADSTLLTNFMAAAVAANQHQIFFSGTSLGAAWRVGNITVPGGLQLICQSAPYIVPSNGIFTTFTPTFVQTGTITYGGNGNNGETGCGHTTTALYSATTPASWRDNYNRVLGFSGFGVTCNGDNGCKIQDASFTGFSTAINLNKNRNAFLNNIQIDALTCIKVRDQGAGQIRMAHITCTPLSTRTQSGIPLNFVQVSVPVSSFSNSAGVLHVNYTGTCTDVNNCPQNGDISYVINPVNEQSAIGKWTVANASSSGYDLSGSSSAFIAGLTQNGTTTTGSVEITGLATGLGQLQRSQLVTGTCITGTATINAIPPGSLGIIELDAAHPATSTGTCSLTITDGNSPASITTAVVVSGGTGYSVGDVLTISGGTSTDPAELTVLTVDGSGAILTVNVTNGGNYSVLPTNPVSVTGGDGTGATFTTASGSIVMLTANQRIGPVFDIAGTTAVKIEDVMTLNHTTGAIFGASATDISLSNVQINCNTAVEDNTQQGLVFTGNAHRVLFTNGSLYCGYGNIVDNAVGGSPIFCNEVSNSSIGGGGNEGYQTTVLAIYNPAGVGNQMKSCFNFIGNISRTPNGMMFVTADTLPVVWADNNMPITQSYCIANSSSVLYGTGNIFAANSCLPTLPSATLANAGITPTNGINCTIGVACIEGSGPSYSSGGTLKTNLHTVSGSVTLSGGTNTVTLVGSAIYTSVGSYFCFSNDESGSAVLSSTSNSSSSQFVVHGTGTDIVGYYCIGN